MLSVITGKLWGFLTSFQKGNGALGEAPNQSPGEMEVVVVVVVVMVLLVVVVMVLLVVVLMVMCMEMVLLALVVSVITEFHINGRN